MITVNEAFDKIMATASDFGTEVVSIMQAEGRVLREKIVADRAFPPFDRVTMDGIAVNWNDFAEGKRTFEVEDLQAAGMPQKTLKGNGCIEVMTGAIIPENTDTVIPYEDLLKNEKAKTFTVEKNINKGQNIHTQGSDVKQGEVLLNEGVKITGAETAILATVGKDLVLVSRQPLVALVATGDELVEITEVPEKHQLRMSNVYALYNQLKRLGIEATIHHIKDEKEALQTDFSLLFEEKDVIICSGGVSAGKFDYIPQVLNDLGVDVLFHKVKQRPGKPFLFGVSKRNVPFFGLPGNPVSGFMCLHRFVIPWLLKSLQLPHVKSITQAVLATTVNFDKPLTFFAPVELSISAQGYVSATPQLTNGSGDFATLTSANAFIELPENKDVFKAGEVYPVWIYNFF